MRVNEDYKTWNASKEAADPSSVLSFWKLALRTRKEHDVLVRLYLFSSSRTTAKCDIDRSMEISRTCALITNKCSPIRELWEQFKRPYYSTSRSKTSRILWMRVEEAPGLSWVTIPMIPRHRSCHLGKSF